MHAVAMFVLQWVFRELVLKFVVFAVVYAVLGLFVPRAIGYVLPYVGIDSLDAAFSGLPAGVWYFLDLFRLDYGLPFVLSCFVSRFLIRRLPVIG